MKDVEQAEKCRGLQSLILENADYILVSYLLYTIYYLRYFKVKSLKRKILPFLEEVLEFRITEAINISHLLRSVALHILLIS